MVCLETCWRYFKIYHTQPVDPDKTVEDSDLQTITPSYHSQPIDPSNDIQSDVANGDVINQEAQVGRKILEFFMVTNYKSKIMPIPTNQQTRVMFPEELMRTSPPGGVPVGACTKDAPEAVGPGLMQSFGEFPPHDELHEQTHSSLTPGWSYAENVSEVSASTHDASKIVVLEDPVEIFRRIIENPEVLSPNSHVGPLDNYNELFGQLKPKLAAIDFLQTIRDDPIVQLEIQGLLLKMRKPDVLDPIANIVLDIEPLLEQAVQVVRQK